MHQQALEFVRRAASEYWSHLAGRRVLEIGSFSVNGDARAPLQPAHFTGVDVRLGRNVDYMIDLSAEPERAALLGSFDAVLCTETLEHAPNPAGLIAAARERLKPGGLLFLTAAGPERAPHGMNGTYTVPPDEHYGNIDPEELRAWLAEGWEVLTLEHDRSIGDVYTAARRLDPPPPEEPAQDPAEALQPQAEESDSEASQYQAITQPLTLSQVFAERSKL